MKQIYFFIVVTLGLTFPPNLMAKPQRRIITMNLHCFEDQWEFRFRNILDYILEINPDVISFQEVCTEPEQKISQIDFIYNYLRSHNYRIQTFEEQYTHPAWNRYDEYLLMISKYSSSKIDKGFLPRSLLQRGFIGLTIDGRWYLNSHLEYKQENAEMRKAQIEYLKERFWNAPQILMGDFNSSPDSLEQKPLWDSQFTPVFPGETFIGHDDNGKNKIDGFWISPQYMQQISQYSGQVVLKEKVRDQYLSDHFGVVINLSFH